MQRRRKRRAAEARRTQAAGALYSHKANPMFDTTQTLGSSSSSARGDDFEVIRVPPGQPTGGARDASPHLGGRPYVVSRRNNVKH